MAPEKQIERPAQANFEVLRRGSATKKDEAVRPPDAMLAGLEDGTVVKGPDGTQWIVMPAIPRRFEKAKRVVKTAAQ